MNKIIMTLGASALLLLVACGGNNRETVSAEDINAAVQAADTTAAADSAAQAKQDSVAQDNTENDKEKLAAKYKSKIEKLLGEMKEGYDYMEEAEYGEAVCTGNNMVYDAQKKIRKYLDYMTDEQKARYNKYKVNGPCDESAYD